MPGQVHSAGWHALRALAHPTTQVATGNAFGYFQQEGHERPSTLTNAWHHIQVSVVHVPSHKRGNNTHKDRPHWRTEQGCRERRNRDRRQGKKPRLCKEAAEEAH